MASSVASSSGWASETSARISAGLRSAMRPKPATRCAFVISGREKAKTFKPAKNSASGWGRRNKLGAQDKVWVLVGTILASSIAFIDESVVNIALPAMEKDLDASVAVIQWIVSAYTLCLAALLLIGGAAGDRYGRRRAFVAGMIIFAA